MPMSHVATLESYIAKNILSEAAFAQYKLGDVAHRELQPYVTELRRVSEAYVTHETGTRLHSPIHSARAAQAYALYYTPINAAKLLHLSPLLQFERSEISMLDVGCGPGTAALAILSSLQQRVRITCVESSPHMSELALSLIEAWDINNNLLGVRMRNSVEPRLETYDLVVAANVLAELSHEQSVATLSALTQSVSRGGYLLLLEPGQQLHTRRLMEMRDRVVASRSDLAPIFPCTRSSECPMLSASATDWCHDTLEWQQPPLNAQLDHLLSFNKHRIKYAAFIFQQGGSVPSGVRILTPPCKTRLGTEALVCGDSFYGTARLRKGLRSERTRPFEKGKVFDRLLVSGSLQEEIAEDTAFAKVDRPRPI